MTCMALPLSCSPGQAFICILITAPSRRGPRLRRRQRVQVFLSRSHTRKPRGCSTNISSSPPHRPVGWLRPEHVLAPDEGPLEGLLDGFACVGRFKRGAIDTQSPQFAALSFARRPDSGPRGLQPFPGTPWWIEKWTSILVILGFSF